MATLLLATTIAGSSYLSGALLTMGSSYIDNSLFGPKTHTYGSRLSDLKIQSSAYGVNIQQVEGTSRAAGNVIWGTKFVEHAKTETSRGGKGGGGGSSSYTTYSYTVSFAVAICEGPIDKIIRVWTDGKPFTLEKSGYSYTLHKGDESQMPDSFIESIEGVGNVPAYRGLAYIVFKDLNVEKFGRRIPSFNFEVVKDSGDVKMLVERISSKAGLASADVDATDLAGLTLMGGTIDQASNHRSKIEYLQRIHLFDCVERNGKVVFKRRKLEDALQIPYEDMGVYEASKGDIIKSTRTDERELPRKLVLNYLSKDNDYQKGTITPKRQITESRNEVNIDLPFVLTDAQAKGLADVLLYEAWVSRTQHDVQLGYKYAPVLPGDILELINKDGSSKKVITTRTSFGKPGIVKLTTSSIGINTYQKVERSVDPGAESGLPTPASSVTFEFMDLPKLPWDVDNNNYLYFATTGKTYFGANLFKTNDGGSSYNFVAQNAWSATLGHTLTILQSGPEHFFDMKNTVDVLLVSGSLESRPQIDILNGFNAALIGNEIIQFTTATLIALNTYRLSGLLRGRLGTEDQITVHSTTDRFVLLNSTTIAKLASNAADWYTPRDYKVGPTTEPVTDETYTSATVTNNARIAQPYAPCHVLGKRAANNDLTISWTRRTRIDGEWRDLSDVALNEGHEAYEVDILTGATVKRTIAVTSPTVVYTSAQQVADFGAAQGSVKIRVYQISETRGRGIAKEVII